MIFIKFRYYSKLLYVPTNPDWWLFICLSSLAPCHTWCTPRSSYSTPHKLSYLEYCACLAHAVYFWESLLILPFPYHWADSPLIHQNSAQISPPPGSLLGLTPQSTLDAASAHGVLINFNKNFMGLPPGPCTELRLIDISILIDWLISTLICAENKCMLWRQRESNADDLSHPLRPAHLINLCTYLSSFKFKWIERQDNWSLCIR